MNYDFFGKDNDKYMPITTLAKWEFGGILDTFLYVIGTYFTPELQEKLMKEEAYTDEEFKYLLYIYVLMDDYHRNHPEIWDDKNIENDEILKIKKYTIKLLSLPSMERYMKEIRKEECYKGIGDFY